MKMEVVRVGIDLTSLGRRPTGIVRYALELAKNLLRLEMDRPSVQGPRVEYVLFFSRTIHPEFQALGNRFEAVICPLRHELWIKQLWFPGILPRYRLDVMHYPAFPPPYVRLRCPITMITFHDAAPWRYPQTLTWRGRYYFRLLLKRSIQAHVWVIAVSAFTRSEQGQLFGQTCLARTFVIPEAARTDFSAASHPAPAPGYSLPASYFFVPATLEPRKNLSRIIEAYRQLRKRHGENCPALVLVGRKGWHCRELLCQLKALRGAVFWLEYVPDSDLISLYQHAICLVFPSLYEGFGLPVLEAMMARCPVITSATSALAEIAGSAALLVNPLEVSEICEAMQQLWLDEAQRTWLIETGLRRLALFTWSETALQTRNAYLQAQSD